MKKDSWKREKGWGLKQTDGGKVGGDFLFFFFFLVKESWRGGNVDGEDDDDGEEGKEVREGKKPNAGQEPRRRCSSTNSAAWCAAAA